MTISPTFKRPLGTMVTYGFRDGGLQHDLNLAQIMGATCVEVLPLWKAFPDPKPLATLISDHGLTLHSAHGCWGGQSIFARRVDLSSLEESVRQESLDDLKRCVNWLAEAGGKFLVVHPGGLNDRATQAEQTAVLAENLAQLAEFAGPTEITLCVENMPPGVYPGSLMVDLHRLVAGLDLPPVALALDTGHAHISNNVSTETKAAGPLLATTHVHDNHGRADVHLPPGFGSIDWKAWVNSLDEIGYEGPIMLECIRYIRDNPTCLTSPFLDLLKTITRTL